MLYFDTNKPHTFFFFCGIPVVLENRRSSQGGEGGARPLHPPPRSAPAVAYCKVASPQTSVGVRCECVANEPQWTSAGKLTVKMNSKQGSFTNKQIVWVACGINHEGILVPGSTGVPANMAAWNCVSLDLPSLTVSVAVQT